MATYSAKCYRTIRKPLHLYKTMWMIVQAGVPHDHRNAPQLVDMTM